MICLDANPLNRPTANEVEKVLYHWYYESGDLESGHIDNETELTALQKQIREAEEINNNLPTGSIPLINLSYKTHSKAVYTSRLLSFNNLSVPKNSDDYYDEQNDNIISENFSESLQIDISQLTIKDNVGKSKII
ncbi:uncharacterized protein OCT59_012406 [Rhizophagus irregularis]|uniref:uncharacterized protein n=1 Tax=Rhizophagus irregularis TaxID=588596 RepID=UPI00332E329F|nr:hypothetical protein OCT59_012406 [Rhizophagus irregularis]